jgi:ligand-binding sensor domain-containing protein
MLLATSFLCVVPAESSSAAPGWAVRYWSGANGLPEEAIYGIQETSDGHLWLATRDGAIRFDGQNFFNTRPAVAPGPRDNSYGAVLAFGDSLWLGGRDFLAYSGTDFFHSHLNPRFRFQSFPRTSGDRFGIIGMQRALDGNIWVVRADGVFQQNPATDFSERFTPVRRYAPPEGETILAFHQGRGGRLWISTDSGVYEILPSGWVRLSNLQPGASHLLEGRDGTLWSFGQKLL